MGFHTRTVLSFQEIFVSVHSWLLPMPLILFLFCIGFIILTCRKARPTRLCGCFCIWREGWTTFPLIFSSIFSKWLPCCLSCSRMSPFASVGETPPSPQTEFPRVLGSLPCLSISVLSVHVPPGPERAARLQRLPRVCSRTGKAGLLYLLLAGVSWFGGFSPACTSLAPRLCPEGSQHECTRQPGSQAFQQLLP